MSEEKKLRFLLLTKPSNLKRLPVSKNLQKVLSSREYFYFENERNGFPIAKLTKKSEQGSFTWILKKLAFPIKLKVDRQK